MKRRYFLKSSLIVGTVLASGGIGACFDPARRKNASSIITQFEDKDLSHFSYAIQWKDKIVLIDPARNPQVYYDHAQKHQAQIIAVIETHPHADFVSSHLEISKKEKAPIYVSKLVKATYNHRIFDDGALISLSEKVKLKAINTPGHSPDSISILLEEHGVDIAVFTGDALLFGSVGRPDLREYSGETASERKQLAHQMYHTVHEKYTQLNDNVLVYPAHGAGSLCATGISNIKESTIGRERRDNFAFQIKDEDTFVAKILADQPHIPKYFPYDVELNKKGAPDYTDALAAVTVIQPPTDLKNHILIDARKTTLFKNSHLAYAINIPDGKSFSTWLGTIVAPEDHFYLIVESDKELAAQLARVANIGYEALLKGVIIHEQPKGEKSTPFEKSKFNNGNADILIVDIRSKKEAQDSPIFKNTWNIPLPNLKDSIQKLPVDKPIYVHCASGYRSAIGSSLIKKYLPNAEVYDISDNIKDYHKNTSHE